MEHAKMRKLLALSLSLGLLAGALGACSKADSSQENPPLSAGKTDPGSSENDSGAPEKGRYVEQEVVLPPEISEDGILQMFKSQDRLHLLTSKSEDGLISLREWELQEGDFQDVTEDWLAEMSFPDSGWIDIKLASGAGARYLFAAYITEEGFLGHLWKGNGSQAEEITPEKWSAPNDETGVFDMVQGLASLDDGTLAVSSLFSLDILSGKDGQVLESESPDSLYDGILSGGKDLFLLSTGSEGPQIERRTNAKKEDSILIPFAVGASPAGASADGAFAIGGGSSFFLDILSDGTLIAASENGIFRLTKGDPEAQWEQLAEGTETDYSSPGFWGLHMNALEDGSIYALFQSDAGQKLNCYRYDPDAASGPQQRLTVYSIYENTLLRQATALYHKAHPEISIDLRYEYPLYGSEDVDWDSVYKRLNTMLLGDDAPDLLVMDHLNAESFISKGLLENLEDVIRPLEDSGELLSNITQTYVREDGSRYVVPLEFSFKLAMGRDIPSESMCSLEALADFLSRADSSYMGPRTASGLVNLFYPFFCDTIVRDKQLDREFLSQYMQYLKAISDNCGLIDSYPEGETAYGMFDLSGKAKLAFYQPSGFSDCVLPMTMVDYIKGDFAALENRFIPSAQLAVCKTCNSPDVAKDFLRFALSLQVQNSDTYQGFPVNRAALAELAGKDRSNEFLELTIMDEEGGFLNFEGKPYSAEKAERLMRIAETLDRPVKEDEKIREVLTEYLADYLRGSRPLEETVDKIEAALKMYLAE